MSIPNCIIVPEFCTVLLVLHFVTDQPNLNLTQLQVVVLLPSGVVHWSNQPCFYYLCPLSLSLPNKAIGGKNTPVSCFISHVARISSPISIPAFLRKISRQDPSVSWAPLYQPKGSSPLKQIERLDRFIWWSRIIYVYRSFLNTLPTMQMI